MTLKWKGGVGWWMKRKDRNGNGSDMWLLKIVEKRRKQEFKWQIRL